MYPSEDTPNDPPGTPPLQVVASHGFPDWLSDQRISLALTTYQIGKLLLIGTKNSERLSVFERTFNRAMGLWSNGQTMWLASAFQLWRLENTLGPGEVVDKYDRLYVPTVGYTTGDIGVHDVAVDGHGHVVVVSSLFNCLATVSERHSFTPLWQPPFISRMAAEDRCHLNGLAMEGGQPLYVTACAKSDVVNGWRDHRRDGGCVVDVSSGEVVGQGLSMPHSPRLYHGRLWLLDSGTGYLGYLDLKTGKFERVTFCPGYARGLAFHSDYAIVGVSRPRHDPAFVGLQLEAELAARKTVARSGLQIVDMKSGNVVQWLRLEGVVEELYDVVVLPGVRRPKALGFKTDEIRRNVWIEDAGRTTRWTAHDKT